MKISVRSSGIGRDFDYSWKGDELSEYYYKVKHLIESESPSIILKKEVDSLFLVVTGVKSDRTDFKGRKIRNSVLWLTDNSLESEKGLRSLASLALKGEIESDFNRLITSDEKQDFQFNKAALQEMAFLTEGIQSQELDKIRNLNQIAKLEEDLKKELAKELETYCLPNRIGVLVVVTGIKSENTLKEANVWRGLSSNVLSEAW
jgi:hypothetical protein